MENLLVKTFVHHHKLLHVDVDVVLILSLLSDYIPLGIVISYIPRINLILNA